MSSARGIFLFVTLAVAFSVADGWWWWDFEWSDEKPANCPHENHDTHVCSVLGSMNATCITIKCCSEFEDDEDSNDYDDISQESDDENVYYLGSAPGLCKMCYTKKPCSVYKCYTRCCKGYEEDIYGRCRNKTDHVQCQNGGTPRGNYFCDCPTGFHGKSCEIPICHCENGGECVVKDGKPFCNCPYGHSGERCEQSLCTTKCQNGGICYKNGTYEFCRCPPDYIGIYCEQHFKQPDTCPVPDSHSYCGTSCTSNSDCGENRVCCMEGCTTVCRKPKASYCVYGDRRYRIGENFRPDACKNCTCTNTGEVMCSSMSCSVVRCPDGRKPETKPGQCCPSCPDGPSYKPPVIYGCPTGILNVDTTYYKDFARFGDWNTDIRAVDYRNNKLEVTYSPSYVRHCRCKNPQGKVTSVQAYAKDRNGNVATCTFKVAVLDKYHPVFRNCPEDIYVFENEVVEWKEPSYYDNVGVAYKSCTDKMYEKKRYFPVGNYTITYQIWDYDQNTAFCRFRVSVTALDTDMENMPQGLRERAKDKSHIMLIVGPVMGAAILIVAALLLLICCRRQRASRTANPQSSGHQTPAYDNNIYAMPGDIDIKLPPYSDLPMNPPAYSLTGSEKDIAYLSLAPPSYSNPGYETLKVHIKKSESVKSTKSEKSDKESESTD